MSVLADTAWIIMKKPDTSRSAQERPRWREKAKPTGVRAAERRMMRRRLINPIRDSKALTRCRILPRTPASERCNAIRQAQDRQHEQQCSECDRPALKQIRLHQQKICNDRDITDTVQEKAPAFADFGLQQTAIAGPTMQVLLDIEKLSAMALIMSSGRHVEGIHYSGRDARTNNYHIRDTSRDREVWDRQCQDPRSRLYELYENDNRMTISIDPPHARPEKR
jgi:hypothetical protein